MQHDDWGVLDHANAELRHFLPETGGREIRLRVDECMESHCFAIEPRESAVTLRGGSETAVLHAVYTMLEQTGFRFEIDRVHRPPEVNWPALQTKRINPIIPERGIRQHINFPMDLSGYPLPEALEYIRNLARLRFNRIVFHSYPFQWVDGPQAGSNRAAGAFFYGQAYPLPDDPALRRMIRNSHTYCIPEIEPLLGDAEAVSRAAVAWLGAVMRESRRCGMLVEFSFEPRRRDAVVGPTIETARRILEMYPYVNRLQLTTQETGTWNDSRDGPSSAEVLTLFGNDTRTDPDIRTLVESGHGQFARVFGEMGHCLHAIKKLQHETPVPLALGVYSTVPTLDSPIVRTVARELPKDTYFMFLPRHSSARVAKCMSHVDVAMLPVDRSTICTWIEFDGTMYLQQNSIPGIYSLLSGVSESLSGILFNHWRTAENRITLRYAAETSLYGPIEPQEFYAAYASAHDIQQEAFALAMEHISQADTVATNELGNIGFCHLNCWGKEGLGYFGNWRQERIRECAQLYESARAALRAGRRGTGAKGIPLLSLLINRVDCTIVYLEAMEEGTDLQRVDPGEENEERIARVCERTLALLDTYARTHTAYTLDRGCEGTLASFLNTPPVFVRQLRSRLISGTTTPARDADQPDVCDAPPSPIDTSERDRPDLA